MSKFNPSCYKEKHIHSSAGVDIAIQQDTMNVLFTKSTNPSRRNQREREREMLQLGRMSLSSQRLAQPQMQLSIINSFCHPEN